MKKIILLLILCLCSVLVMATSNDPEWSDTAEENFDVTDLTLFGNEYDKYQGNFILPPYIPNGVWSKLKTYNYTRSAAVIGRHVPRYFDGEKYTDFRVDGFNPDNLTIEEKEAMDSINFIVQHESQEGGDSSDTCELTAYFETTKNYGIPKSYSDTDTTLLIEIPYAYDMGYFYIPEIRDIIAADCYNILDGLHPSVIRRFCEGFIEGIGSSTLKNVIDSDVATFENKTSYLESEDGVGSRLLAYDPYNLLGYVDPNGYSPSLELPCIYYPAVEGSGYVTFCYSEQDLRDAYSILDEWMIQFIKGLYVPRDCENALQDYANNNAYYKEALETTETSFYDNIMFVGSLFKFGLSAPGTIEGASYQQQVYEIDKIVTSQIQIDDTRKKVCDIKKSYTPDIVEDLIWTHYRDTYKIQKGTNLYPFNIDRIDIRCHDNAQWEAYYYGDRLLPNQQTPTIFCDYSNQINDEVNVGFKITLRHNPVWATVVGADTINEGYDTGYLKYLFATENILGTEFVNYKSPNFDQIATLGETFKLNRSTSDGCFVYINVSQVGSFVEDIDDASNDAQGNAEGISNALDNQRTLQLSLLRSELEKNNFYGFLEIIAQLIFRLLIMVFYIIQILVFFWILKLLIDIPLGMLDAMSNLGKPSKGKGNNRIIK